MLSKQETKLVESMAVKLSRQVRFSKDDTIQAAWLCRSIIKESWDPTAYPDWMQYLAIRIRRATLAHLVSTRQVRRVDRGNISDFMRAWPTAIGPDGTPEPQDFQGPEENFESLDETLEDIRGLSMKERAVITYRYIRGESRDSVMERMALSSYEMNCLVFSARSKVKEALA